MKVAFILLGILFLGLGILGIPLPVLPTTPFLLLASYCFMKGSKRLDTWFKNTKIYSVYLKDYNPKAGMTIRKKVNILLLGTATIGLSFILVNHIHVRILLTCVLLIKYYFFLFRIKTVEKQSKDNCLS